ncbi:MAG TPA: hypothetical protein H9729_01420 [Candidatus Borkfalkia excrementigallinarum]|uniref:Uncharacterized protein n=1 Tax=Candidatus Borkfalkia excrementigallinarum TaxID=2838506 RepID=A0A9D1ZUC9_9FIRM|nr:hypothetical protein [Candidatus Borkfalkia excrementigallinarum]
MKEHKGEEKLVFSLWQKWKKHCKIFVCIACGIFAVIGIISACVSQWLGALIAGGGIFVFSILLLCFFIVLNFRRIEIYADRVSLVHEIMTDPASHTISYSDIEAVVINPVERKGDHVEGVTYHGFLVGDVDTLCVYCKNGDKFLFGLKNWGEVYCRSLTDELLCRAQITKEQCRKFAWRDNENVQS